MDKAKFGRIESMCPQCGSLSQLKFKDVVIVDNLIVEFCNGCRTPYKIVLDIQPVGTEEIDTTPPEMIEELSEKTKTRVRTKTLSKNVRQKSRQIEKDKS